MSNWYDEAMNELEEMFEEGTLDAEGLRRAIRDLDEEFEEHGE